MGASNLNPHLNMQISEVFSIDLYRCRLQLRTAMLLTFTMPSVQSTANIGLNTSKILKTNPTCHPSSDTTIVS